MDKSVNLFARRTLGFFFTSNKPSNDNKKDFELLDKAVKYIGLELRTRKLRANNVTSHFHEIGELIEDVYKFLREESKDMTQFHAQAYASALVYAVIGWRNERFTNSVEKDDQNQEKSKNE